MNIIHYLNQISFTEILAYALLSLAGIYVFLFVVWVMTYHAAKHKMKQKAKPVVRHINIKV